MLAVGASPTPVRAEEQVAVSLELSTLAPATIVQALQEGATDDWLGSLLPSFSDEDRDLIHMMAVERTPRGVRVRIDLKEDVDATATYRAPVEAALAQLAQTLPRPYSYTMKEAKPPREESRVPWPWLLGIMGLGGLLLILRRRPAFLSQPYFRGLPMAGFLPAGVGMGGKFLELQSAPCQSMGAMVRKMALHSLEEDAEASDGENRMLAIASTGDPAATAVVTAALGISLVRDGHRVLVVDFLGADSVLSDVLEESDDDDSLAETGDHAALRHTGIPDLDLMTAQSLSGTRGIQKGEPLLPRSLTDHFGWTLLVLPQGSFVPILPTFPVFSSPTSQLAVWRTRLLAWRQKARIRGAILVGLPLSNDVRERMLARSYYERIRSLSGEAS